VFGNLRTFKVINEKSHPSRGHEMDLELELGRVALSIGGRRSTTGWCGMINRARPVA
jgi:hypothetical protein